MRFLKPGFLVVIALLLPAIARAEPDLAWNLDEVDSAGNVGKWPSLALDAAENPHISYYDYEAGDLKYAWWDGGWKSLALDTEGDVGAYSSLALDTEGDAHIAYWSISAGAVKYIRSVAGQWQTPQILEETGGEGWELSLALGQDNKPHLSYYNFWADELRYAHFDGAWHKATVASGGDMGSFSSLALDPQGVPHISYVHNQALYYASPSEGPWSAELVDNLGNVGRYPSLRIDGSGRPHISYFDLDQRQLKYARHDGTWQPEVVDGSELVGLESSLAVGDDGSVHISYYDYANMGLRYIRSEGPPGAGQPTAWDDWRWVDADGNPGLYSSLALDDDGYPHIAYYGAAEGELRYATLRPLDTTPPDTHITSNPSHPSSSSAASFTFAGADDQTSAEGLRFECALKREEDGAEPTFEACASPRPYSGLADGQYSFSVRAIDSRGNADPSPALYRWTVDIVCPGQGWQLFSVPDPQVYGQPAMAIDSKNAPHLAYVVARGPRYFLQYARLVDGSWQIRGVARVSGPSRVDLRLDGDGRPTVAYASGGAIRIATSADGKQWQRYPAFEDYGGDNFSLALDSDDRPRLAYAAYSPVTGAAVQYAWLAGQEWQVESVFDPLFGVPHAGRVALAIDSQGIPQIAYKDVTPPGQVRYAVRGSEGWNENDEIVEQTGTDSEDVALALDSSGKPFVVYLDTPHEALKLAIGAGDDRVWRELARPESQLWFSSIAVDAAGAAHVAYRENTSRDVKYIRSAETTTFANVDCASDLGLRPSLALNQPGTPHISYLDEGKHELRYAVLAGADQVAPKARITSGPRTWTSSRTATFAFSGSDNLPARPLSFECSLDGGSFRACVSPYGLSNLAEGSHLFLVRAQDASGNRSTPTARPWFVDATPPTTTLTSWPNNPGGSAATFTFSGADALSPEGSLALECALDQQSFARCDAADRQHYDDLPDGSHTFRVRAVDLAGNADQSPETITWEVDSSMELLNWSPAPVLPAIANRSIGMSPALALDAGGHPHIAFHSTGGELGNSLEYVYFDGANWQRRPAIYSQDLYGSESVSLALSRGIPATPHVAYMQLGQLYYARWTSGRWDVTKIGGATRVGRSLAIALNQRNLPLIAYHDTAAHELRYVYRAEQGGAWQSRTVAGGLDSVTQLSLVLDDQDRPHIVYYSSGGADGIMYAEPAQPAPRAVAPGVTDVRALQLALDSAGNPHVAYLGTGGVAYRYRSSSAGPWQRPADDLGFTLYSDKGAGFLALDGQDRPYIAYQPDIRSVGLARFDGNTWQKQLVYALSQDEGYVTDIALATDGTGRPHLAFHLDDLSPMPGYLQGLLMYAAGSRAPLDMFNRPDGPPGASWRGSSGYAVKSNLLSVSKGGALLWAPRLYGSSQEAAVTLTTISKRAGFYGLVLKASRAGSEPGNRITVGYDARRSRVQIKTYNEITNSTPAAKVRSNICRASSGLVAKARASGIPAARQRSRSAVHALGKYSSRSIRVWPCSLA